MTWDGGHGWATKHGPGEAPATHKSPPRSRAASQPSALLTPTAWQTTPRPATQRMVRGDRGHGVAHGQWPAVSSPQFSLPMVGNAEVRSKIGATTSPLMRLPSCTPQATTSWACHGARRTYLGDHWESRGCPRGSVEAALEVAALAVATCGGMGGIGWSLLGAANSRYEWLGRGGISRGTGWPVTWHASNLLLRASCRAYNNVVEAMVEPLLSPCLCSRPAGSPSLWSAKVPSKFQLPGSAFKLQASHKVTPARVVRGH